MRSVPGQFERRDWVIAAFLFVLAFALHVPFRSQFAYHWDGAQFALAIGSYDMRISQPHPPGYFMYVMLGKLVNLGIGEPHTSLVWLSVIAGAALAAVGFLLANAMFGRRIGIATAVILLTSPLCWFYSEIALTSIVDAMLVTATVLVCWRVIKNGGGWRDVLWMSMLFAVVAGVRQQTGAILAPLWCYSLLKVHGPRWTKLVCGLLLAGLFCSLWFLPMVRTTGGITEYLHLLRAKGHFDAPQTAWGGGGIAALLVNVSMIGRVCWVGLLFAAVIFVSEFLYWVFGEQAEVKRQLYGEYAKQFVVLSLWIGPMLLFWLAMYVTTPGYVLCFFPALAIVAGMAVQRFVSRLTHIVEGRKPVTEQRRKLLATLVALGLVAGVNVVVFLWQPRCLTPVLADLPLTAMEIRRHDRQLAECFRTVREKFKPENVVIYHSDQFFYWGFRQFQYHLPEYPNVLLTPDASLSGELQRKLWVGQWRQTIFLDSVDNFAGRNSLLIVPPGESVKLFQQYFNVSRAELLAESGMKLYVVKPHH
jgi:hypothetical protein